MALESWQITYVLGVFIGLLIGLLFNPWLGAAFIWAFVIVVEVLSFNKQRRVTKASTEAKHSKSKA
jgi:UDP-N-acetylmuramyl pentapeptide phosphotransferase/UDP-N-acetylglucosamine-1-phosphate transferase